MSSRLCRVRGRVPLWLSLLSMLSLASWTGTAWSQETLGATADAYTKNNEPDTNFGNRYDFRAQNWAGIRGFVKFDTASFSASSAGSATLELYVVQADMATTIDIHKVLADWGEYTLTTNNQPAYEAQAGASFPVGPSDVGTTISVDVTALLNQLLADPGNDFGLVLRTDYGHLIVDAREATNGPRIIATPAGGGANQAPEVDAGADRTVTAGVAEPLEGSVADDGLPNPPAATAIAWSKVSGPGSVSFDDASDPTTDVSMTTPGTYVLRLSADDGEYETTDGVEITVIDPPEEITLTTTGDTTTKQGEPDQNFGVDSKVRIQKWSQLTGWYAFDFGSLPQGFLASDAQLKFRVQAVGLSGPITVHKALGSWSESTLTHNNMPALGPVAATFDIAPSDLDTIMQVDITALFNELAADPQSAYGIVLKTADANFFTDSRESGTATWIIATPQQVNLAPEANAGADLSVTLPAEANLSGSVADDGLPNPPGATSVTWDKQSGPGTVTFGDATSLATTASFSAPGTYVLRLTADDGEYTDTDTLTVEVGGGASGPGTPSPITGPSSDTDGAYTLNWGSVAGADTYELQIRLNDGGWATLQSSGATSRPESGRPDGVWGYRVRACDAGICGDWTAEKAVTVVIPPGIPGDIDGPDFVYVAIGDYQLSWSAASGSVSGYQLQESINSTSNWSLIQDSPATGRTFVDRPGGVYNYRVRAYNTVGEYSAYGGYTAIKPVSVGEPDTDPEAQMTTDYEYDARGRLIKVVHSGDVNDGVTVNYQHDKAGNRKNKTVTTD